MLMFILDYVWSSSEVPSICCEIAGTVCLLTTICNSIHISGLFHWLTCTDARDLGTWGLRGVWRGAITNKVHTLPMARRWGEVRKSEMEEERDEV